MVQGQYEVETPQDLCRILNLQFKNYSLLTRAFTHRSYLNEHPEALEDNERLEFLGDAVLDFVSGAWLYNRFPEMAEGGLTRLRSALVRTEQLAEFAKSLKFDHAILLGRGEEESGGRFRPTLLCATFEAFVGALFLDSGIDKVREFVEPLFESIIEDLVNNGDLKDPKSVLQEWVQSRGMGTPEYRTVDEMGPDHDKIFTIEVRIDGKVYGRGTGHSKQAATKEAAKVAIQQLGIA